jgi:hypothetical protein
MGHIQGRVSLSVHSSVETYIDAFWGLNPGSAGGAALVLVHKTKLAVAGPGQCLGGCLKSPKSSVQQRTWAGTGVLTCCWYSQYLWPGTLQGICIGCQVPDLLRGAAITRLQRGSGHENMSVSVLHSSCIKGPRMWQGRSQTGAVGSDRSPLHAHRHSLICV